MATQVKLANGTTAQQTIGSGTAVNGDPVTPVVFGSKGALHSRVMPGAIVAHPAADTNNAATFTEAEGVSSISILCTIVTPVADDESDEYCFVVLDAPNAVVAEAWLNGATAFNISADAYVIKIPFNEKITIPLSSYIRRVDVQPTAIAHILIEGV